MNGGNLLVKVFLFRHLIFDLTITTEVSLKYTRKWPHPFGNTGQAATGFYVVVYNGDVIMEKQSRIYLSETI